MFYDHWHLSRRTFGFPNRKQQNFDSISLSEIMVRKFNWTWSIKRITTTIPTNIKSHYLCCHGICLRMFCIFVLFYHSRCNRFIVGRIKQRYFNKFIAFTLCLSMCSGRRYGSNSSLSGSISIGDCRRPFVHIFHYCIKYYKINITLWYILI